MCYQPQNWQHVSSWNAIKRLKYLQLYFILGIWTKRWHFISWYIWATPACCLDVFTIHVAFRFMNLWMFVMVLSCSEIQNMPYLMQQTTCGHNKHNILTMCLDNFVLDVVEIPCLWRRCQHILCFLCELSTLGSEKHLNIAVWGRMGTVRSWLEAKLLQVMANTHFKTPAQGQKEGQIVRRLAVTCSSVLWS